MRDLFEDVGEVFFALCKSVNTPRSLGYWLSWKYKSYASVTGPHPSDYCNANDFSVDYLCYSWAKKIRPAKDDKKAKKALAVAALGGFIADEFYNSLTNYKLKKWNRRGAPPRIEACIHMARRKIDHILGPMKLSEVLECCRFGNGATATLLRKQARPDQKITTIPVSVTPNALSLGRALLESSPQLLFALTGIRVDGPCSLLPCCFEVIDYNVFDTSPKDLTTDRTIGKEATLDGLLQQGVHMVMRRRLMAAGIDLTDQRINQTWAELAQILELATLDARSASNSVTIELVKLLLSDDWYWLLNSLRSRNTLLPKRLLPDGTEDDVIHRNQMFSSMGNAFTFELESLIFYAIISSVCPQGAIISVYGDDMIVPQANADDCIDILEAFGFRINRMKSYTSGRFFESCGSHYFDSLNVTPAYQKANPLGSRFERIAAHNRLIRWALRSGRGVVLNSVVRPVCELLMRGHEKYAGPLTLQDDRWFNRPLTDLPRLYSYKRIKAWAPNASKVNTRHAGALALRLMYADQRGDTLEELLVNRAVSWLPLVRGGQVDPDRMYDGGEITSRVATDEVTYLPCIVSIPSQEVVEAGWL